MTDFKDMSEAEREESMKQFVNKIDETVGGKVRTFKGWAQKIGGGFFLLIALIIFLAGSSSTAYIIGGVFFAVGLLLFTYGLARVSYSVKKIVSGLVVTAAGIGFIFFGIGEFKKGKASQAWPTVTGKISESKLEEYTTTEKREGRKKKVTRHRAVINYAYNVEATVYSSNRIAFGGQPDSPYNLVKAYPQGKEVKVYYHPQDHSMAVLQPGLKKGSYFFLGFGVVLGLFGLIFAFRGQK